MMNGANGELKIVVLCRECESSLSTSISISSSAIILTHKPCANCSQPAPELIDNDRAQYERTIREQALRLVKLDNELSNRELDLEVELRKFCSWWWKRHCLERMCEQEGADPITDVGVYLAEQKDKT